MSRTQIVPETYLSSVISDEWWLADGSGVRGLIVFVTLQIGGTYAKPVILPPEVAIGALGKIQVSFSKF